MSKIKGFFDPASPDNPTARGYVQARILLPPSWQTVEVGFAVDTGCRHIVLLDQDMLDVLWAYGFAKVCVPDTGNPGKTPSISRAIDWMREQRHLFCCPAATIRTIAGTLTEVFLLKHAVALLCNRHSEPSRGAAELRPIYGAFSKSFLCGDFSRTFSSLLGRQCLASVRQMHWYGRKRRIAISDR